MVLVGAILINVRPQEKRIWGVGFTGMGFSILGAILGVIGRIIGLGVTFRGFGHFGGFGFGRDFDRGFGFRLPRLGRLLWRPVVNTPTFLFFR
jgi:hypothetical protein